jgi:prepilin-type N-terminal cleavage/methylation domain-containing protein
VLNSRRTGYTLVEVVVALLVFTVGALALAASSAVVAKNMEANALRERAGRIAASRIERIKSECTTATSGAEVLQGVLSEWSVARGGEAVSILESTRYASARGYTSDRYEAIAWCSP